MNAPNLQDPATGLAFLRRARHYVCTLAPVDPERAAGQAQLAFAFPGEERRAAALEFARHAAGRHYAMLLERIEGAMERWPTQMPRGARALRVERDGWVLLAASPVAHITMPPALPHLSVVPIDAWPAAQEAQARAALAALGHAGLLARVEALLLGESGAELDVVWYADDGVHGGWFAATPAATVDPGTEPEAPAPRPPRVDTVPYNRGPNNRGPNDSGPDDSGPDDSGPDDHNAALVARLAPPYVRDRAPSPDTARVEALEASIATADELLWSQPDGVHWTADFERSLCAQLRARHAWLDARGLAALLGYARWLSWHEGLGRRED